MVDKHEIVRLEEYGITAKVTDDGQLYTTHIAFSKAAGYPDAVGVDKDYSEIEGSTVGVLAKGIHGSYRETIYVIETGDGERFLIGEKGLTVDIEVPTAQTLIEKARTVFKRTGETYVAHKTRGGELVRDGQYSERFVVYYATVTQDVLIIE